MAELSNNVAADIILSPLLSQCYSEFCACFKPKELFSSVCFAIVFCRFNYFSNVFTRLNLFVAVRLVVIIKFQIVLFVPLGCYPVHCVCCRKAFAFTSYILIFKLQWFTLVLLWGVEIHHMAPVAVQLHGTGLRRILRS